MPEWLQDRLVEFAEENWTAFIQRCEEGGIPEEDIEEALDEWRKNK